MHFGNQAANQYTEFIINGMLSRANVLISYLSCFIFSIILCDNYVATAKTGEIAIRDSQVLLREGDAMKVTLTAKEPTMHEVSFLAKRVGVVDPFKSSQISLTVQVYENDHLVASESFAWSLGDKMEKVTVQINNSPKIDEKYKMLVYYEFPEDKGQKSIPIQIDTERIKINGGSDGIDVQCRVKLIPSSI